MDICFAIVFSSIMIACSNANEYRSTAEKYLTEQNASLPNYVIDKIEIREDTIPAYFTCEMFALADRAAMSLEWFKRANENRRLGIPTPLIYDMQKQSNITEEEMADYISKAKNAFDSIRRDGQSVVKHVAYVDAHYGTKSDLVKLNEIIIIDNDNPKQVLAYHRANRSLADNLFTLLFLASDSALRHDAFGNLSFDSEPYIVRNVLSQR